MRSPAQEAQSPQPSGIPLLSMPLLFTCGAPGCLTPTQCLPPAGHGQEGGHEARIRHTHGHTHRQSGACGLRLDPEQDRAPRDYVVESQETT